MRGPLSPSTFLPLHVTASMVERTSLSQAPDVQAHLQPLMRLAEQTTVRPGGG
jgi:hypothetical protein